MATNADKIAAAQRLLAKNKKKRSFAKQAIATGWKPPKAGQTKDITPTSTQAPPGTKTGDLARNVTASSYTRYVKQEDHNRAYGSKAGFIPPLKIKVPTKQTPSRPKKTTYGHGKDKAGKSLGITTVVDAGHSPSAAKIKTATRMAKNQKPKSGKEFKFGSNSYGSGPPKGKWGPHGPYRLPDYAKAPPTTTPTKTPTTSTGSFSAKGIAASILAGVAAVTAGVIAKQQFTNTPPKRNKSAAIQKAKLRKPVDPAKVKAVAIGGRREHGDPYKRNKANVNNAVKAAERADARNSRPPMAGGDRGNLRSNAPQINDAFQAAERADAREKAKFSPPKSPEVAETKVEVAPNSTPTEFAPKQSVASRIRDAFRPESEFQELQAARKRGQAAPATVTPPTSTEQPSVLKRTIAATSDTRSEALAEEQAARQAVKAPEPVKEIETPVDAEKKPGKVKSAVVKVADTVVPGRKKRKAKKAAETKITTPVDPAPKAEPVDSFTETAKDLSAEERQIEISKREAALETDRAQAAQRVANAQAKLARQTAAAGEAGLATDVVMPKPLTQADDQEAARKRAASRQKAPKAEGYEPWSPGDAKAATPAARTARIAELETIQAAEAKAPKATTTQDQQPTQRVRQRRGSSRMTTKEARVQAAAGRTPAQKNTTRRTRGSTLPRVPRVADAKITTPVDAVVKQHAEAAKNAEPERTAEPDKPTTKKVKGNKQFWNVKKKQWEFRGETDPTTAVTDRGAKTTVPGKQVTAATGDAVQDLVLEDIAERGRATNEAKIEAHTVNTPVSTTASTPTAKSKADKKTAAERAGLTQEEFAAKTTVVPPKEKRQELTPEEEELHTENKKRIAEIETELAAEKAQTTTLGDKVTQAQADAAYDKLTDEQKKAKLAKDVADPSVKRVISSTLTNAGERETVVLERGELDAIQNRGGDVREAVDNQRKEDRRQDKRRKDRSTKADAETLLEGSQREGQAVPKVTTRRSPGQDPRGTGTNPLIKTPVDAEPEVNLENKSVSETSELTDAERHANDQARRDFKQKQWLTEGTDRRHESILDAFDAEDWKETRERAALGDKASQDLLNKGRAEHAGREKARRALDRVPRQIAAVERQLESGGKSAVPEASTPLAIRAQPDTAGIKVTTPVTAAPTLRRTNVLPSIADVEAEAKLKPAQRAGAETPLEQRAPSNRVDAAGKLETKERRRSTGRRVITTPVDPAVTELPEERRIVETAIASGDQRKHQQSTQERSTTTRGETRGGVESRREGGDRRVTRGEGPTGTEGGRTYNPANYESNQPATPGENKVKTEGWWTGAKKSVNRVFDMMGKAKANLTGPMIDRVAENARKTHLKEGFLRKAGKGTMNVGIGAAVLGTAFAATDAIASVFDVEGAGRSQRDKIREAAETALETGMDTAVGVTEFTVATKAAAAAGPGGVPFTIAANVVLPIGVMAGTAAAVGSVAGKTKHAWDSQVQKEISEKAVMDAKYGTVERATQTRRNRNRKISLDEADVFMQRWDDEAKAKRDKRIKDAKKTGRRPRGV